MKAKFKQNRYSSSDKATSYMKRIGYMLSACLLAGDLYLLRPALANEACEVPQMKGCQNQISHYNNISKKMEVYCEIGRDGDFVQILKAANYDCENKNFDLLSGEPLVYTYDPNTSSFVTAKMGDQKISIDEDLTKLLDPLAVKLSKYYSSKTDQISQTQVKETKHEEQTHPKDRVDKAIRDLHAAEAVTKKIIEDYGLGTIEYKDNKLIIKSRIPINVEVTYPNGERKTSHCRGVCEFRGPIDSILITRDGDVLGEYDLSDITKPLLIGYSSSRSEIEISRLGIENSRLAGRGRFNHRSNRVSITIEAVKDGQLGGGVVSDIDIKGIGIEGRYFDKEETKDEGWSQTSITEEGLTQDEWQNTNITERNWIGALGMRFAKDRYSGLLRFINGSQINRQQTVGGSHIYGTINYPIDEIGEVIEIPVDEGTTLSGFTDSESRWLGFYTQHDINLKIGTFSPFFGYGESRNRTNHVQSENGEESGSSQKDIVPLTIAGVGWIGKKKNYFLNMYTLQGQDMSKNSINFNMGGILSGGSMAFNVGRNYGTFGGSLVLGLDANPSTLRRYQEKMIEYSIQSGHFSGLHDRMKEFHLRDAFCTDGTLLEVRAREPSILGVRFCISKEPLELMFGGEYGLSGNNFSPDTTYGRLGFGKRNFSLGIEMENVRNVIDKDALFVGPYMRVIW